MGEKPLPQGCRVRQVLGVQVLEAGKAEPVDSVATDETDFEMAGGSPPLESIAVNKDDLRVLVVERQVSRLLDPPSIARDTARAVELDEARTQVDGEFFGVGNRIGEKVEGDVNADWQQSSVVLPVKRKKLIEGGTAPVVLRADDPGSAVPR